jgi:hypothetical protein
MIDQLRLEKKDADGLSGGLFERQVSNRNVRLVRAKPEPVNHSHPSQ